MSFQDSLCTRYSYGHWFEDAAHNAAMHFDVAMLEHQPRAQQPHAHQPSTQKMPLALWADKFAAQLEAQLTRNMAHASS